MVRWLVTASVVAIVLSQAGAADPARSIERKDPKFDELIAKDAKIEELAGGFKWSEGPVWVKSGGYLLFSDIPNNVVRKWNDKDGLADYLKPAGYSAEEAFAGKEPGSNGLAINKEGELVLCQHGDRRISKLVMGKFITLADKYDGKRFNSPNDLVFHTNGDLYFTDPPYGLPMGMDDPKKELPYQGVYCLKPDGKVTLLTKEMTRPNGIALSPDQKTLYVANSDPEKAIWMSYPIKGDGTLGEGKVFFDSTEWVKAKQPGLPDGLKVDAAGNIWATGPGGVLVFDATGKYLGGIKTGTPTANCGFGDDGSTLYITANDKLIRIRTKVKGQGF
ncbi:MAG: SMP-30/gluconolactonase/LRE family protein [Gemmataceae bacterium]